MTGENNAVWKQLVLSEDLSQELLGSLTTRWFDIFLLVMMRVSKVSTGSNRFSDRPRCHCAARYGWRS